MLWQQKRNCTLQLEPVCSFYVNANDQVFPPTVEEQAKRYGDVNLNVQSRNV